MAGEWTGWSLCRSCCKCSGVHALTSGLHRALTCNSTAKVSQVSGCLVLAPQSSPSQPPNQTKVLEYLNEVLAVLAIHNFANMPCSAFVSALHGHVVFACAGGDCILGVQSPLLPAG